METFLSRKFSLSIGDTRYWCSPHNLPYIIKNLRRMVSQKMSNSFLVPIFIITSYYHSINPHKYHLLFHLILSMAHPYIPLISCHLTFYFCSDWSVAYLRVSPSSPSHPTLVYYFITIFFVINDLKTLLLSREGLAG